MKKIITIAIILITIIVIFFIKFNYKSLKNGNNMSNKSAKEITQYILDINSYEAESEVLIESNKNSNKYKIKEKYSKDNNVFKREILEPENLNGVSFIYDGTNLKVQNSALNLNKIYENYPYIGEDNITLVDFINDYKKSSETNVLENAEELILEVKIKNGNKYVAYKKMFINKTEGKIKKLEIQDITQKTIIYILYNEIKINNLQKEDVLAFNGKIANDI